MSEAEGPLPKEGTQIHMSWQGGDVELGVAESHGHETLWTEGMGTCVALATFDEKTGKRTLCHIHGGVPDETHFNAVAAELDNKNTTAIILVAGDEVNLSWFKDTMQPNVKEGVKKAMEKAKKKTDKLEFHPPFWTDPADDFCRLKEEKGGVVMANILSMSVLDIRSITCSEGWPMRIYATVSCKITLFFSKFDVSVFSELTIC